MVETINKVIRVSRQLLQELGHDPSAEEIAAEMGMPVEKVREILKIARYDISVSKTTTMLFRLRGRLKKHFMKEGISL